MTPAEQFFYDNAGYAYFPSVETVEEGRRRCAKLLAEAEARASAAGYAFEWQIDDTSDSSEWRVYPEPCAVWICFMRAPDGKIAAALGAIDFGRDGEPWGNPYRRVVEAELASEHFAD